MFAFKSCPGKLLFLTKGLAFNVRGSMCEVSHSPGLEPYENLARLSPHLKLKVKWRHGSLKEQDHF